MSAICLAFLFLLQSYDYLLTLYAIMLMTWGASNWGRLLRTMRVRLEDNGEAEYSKTLDMRIAWGVTQPRLPGW